MTPFTKSVLTLDPFPRAREDVARGVVVTRFTILIVIALLATTPAAADEAAWKEHFQAGTAAYQRADYRGAAPRLEAAAKEAEQFGPDDARLATSLGSLADLYRVQERFAEAEALYRRALAIREKTLGPEHPAVATTAQNFAVLYRLQGRYTDAEPLLQRSLAIREKALKPEHPDIATSLHGLAVLYLFQTRQNEAVPLFERSLAIREKALGPNHVAVAEALNSLAAAYRGLGRQAEAEPLFRRALEIRENTLGPEHPAVAATLNDLALSLVSQSRYAEAEPLYQRALAIREKALGPEHSGVAGTLHNLANLYRAQGRNSEAEPLYQRALAIREKVLPPEHPAVAATRNNLAALYRSQNRDAEATALYRQVLATRKPAQGNAAAPITEADIEMEIGKSLSSGSIRELQARANAEPPKTTDRHRLAVFYDQRAEANNRLGDHPRAIADLKLALDNSRDTFSVDVVWGERFRIMARLAFAYETQGDRFSAIEMWQQIVREYPQTNLYLTGLLRIMNGYNTLGQRAEAEKARQQADEALARARISSGAGNVSYHSLYTHSSNMAIYFAGQGNHAETEKRYRDSLDLAEKNLVEARRTLSRGHARVRGAEQMLASAKINLANILSTRGKYGEAESVARAGFEDRLAWYGFNTGAIAGGLSSIAWSKLQQGETTGAERYYRYSLAAIEGSGVLTHSSALAAHRAHLANALLIQGRWDEALKLFEQRDWGLRSDAAQFKRTGSNHVGWAYALHKAGQSPRAAQMVGTMAANQAKRPVPNRWYIAQLRGVQGLALAASGKPAEALEAFQSSIPELLRRDQDDATEENTGFSRAFWQRAILEGYLELLTRLHGSGQQVTNLDLVDEAFRIADIARGSLVQEAIAATAVRAQLPDRSLAELARREHDALNRIVALNKVLAYLASSSEERREKLIADVRADIERLRKERVQLRADIGKRYPEYAKLVDPKPVGIAETSKTLAAGEVLVSIYLGESHSYIWTIAAGGKATLRVVAIKREEVESDVRELRKAVDFGDGNPARLRAFDLARAHKLYRTYFEPDEALWKDAQVLNVITHGALGEIPFAMLVTALPQGQVPAGAQSAYSEVPWLIRKAAIAQLPSASAFTALRRAPPVAKQRQPFIGFGDPMFTNDAGAGERRSVVRSLAIRKVADTMEDRLKAMAQGKDSQSQAPALATRNLSQAFGLLSSLPDTADELKEIAAVLKADANGDVFINRRATEKNVKQTGLENRRVVMFATHGIAPGELTGLDQPALALSNPALTGDTDNDGFLTMEEVLGLKLDADWVVLSACNTGSADGRGSEAVSGLGRAFFYAGARSLLVSNWAVETTSARLLTTELFRRQAENPQLTRAEALRQSMLDLMGKKAAGGFSYAHPAFWAPFSLVGDGGR